jgi:hypothetical protein
MLTVGVDIRKKTLTICVLDESDKPVTTKRIENTVERVVEFFSPYRGDARVAIEPTHNWGPIHDLLTEMGAECKVSDPRQNRLIGKAVVKTDRLDAKRLATLFRVDMLPLCYAAPPDVRRRREKVRARASLVRTCTSLKNQLHDRVRFVIAAEPESRSSLTGATANRARSRYRLAVPGQWLQAGRLRGEGSPEARSLFCHLRKNLLALLSAFSRRL